MSQLKPLIAGNWKMNGSKSLISEFVQVFNSDVINDIDVLICPPSVYIDSIIQQKVNTQCILNVGAQNVSDKSQAPLLVSYQ